ncbi:MAG: rhodanese-like domain-containing protein [Rubrivivax sp.]|nr:MAG: rhodanese-like domain-containing protein [Rubrivivax sp.]
MAHNETFLKLAAEAKRRVTLITPAQARERISQGAVLIDVRDAEELVDKPAIPGAIHISRGRLESKITDVVPDTNTPVILYCGGGNRGVLATDTLRQLGYAQAANLEGGLRAWLDDAAGQKA